ncbi:MAG: M42 family metallopeptidase [Chitinophagales bacterium]
MNTKALKELIAIDSPSGYTREASQYVFDYLKNMGWNPEFTNKGAVKCNFGQEAKLSIAAHVDTLGAVVSGINSDGTLRFSKVGGPSLNAYEGSYVRIRTLEDKCYEGTLLLKDPAVHANNKQGKTERSEENMCIRIDEEVDSKESVEKLGVSQGDFICFEPYYTELDSGFIKSKFMDNKAGCFVLMELAKNIKASGKSYPVEIFFSNYEEVGHGGTVGYGSEVDELLVIDMGVIGEACSGLETTCSICAKDSSGPYDYEFRKKLTQLAQKNKIPHRVDVYPFYGSDGSAALRAGNDLRVGLIGPGVSASHGIERTHKKGIQASIELCEAYIKSRFGN